MSHAEGWVFESQYIMIHPIDIKNEKHHCAFFLHSRRAHRPSKENENMIGYSKK